MRKKKTWRRVICLALLGCVAVTLVSMSAFANECADIRGEVLRLHVMANSDGEADQTLKLKVRDAVLKETDGLLVGISNKEDAIQTVQASLPRLASAAEACIREQGYGYSAKAELCEMYFTTREYEQGTLPAGDYTALRITIGEGAGHNWWCVVYPGMCLSGAAEWSDVLDDSQTDIVENPERYEVRLKVVEWAQELWHYVTSLW